MIKIKEILNAYETIQRAKIEEELRKENKKIKNALNEHYTCYNRCYYLKYQPKQQQIITNILKSYKILNNLPEKEKIEIEKIITRLEKHHIYWKLENKI